MVTKPEQDILRQICKESREVLWDIHTILGKVYDDELAFDLNLQAARYSRIEEKAAQTLKEIGNTPEKPVLAERTKRWAALQANTLFNISTPHIAELILEKKNENLEKIKETVEENPVVHNMVYEFANEFMDFEKETIRILKSYL